MHSNIFNTNGSHLLLFQGFVLKRIKYFVYPMLTSSVFEWIVYDGWIHGVSIIKDLAISAVVLIGYGNIVHINI